MWTNVKTLWGAFKWEKNEIKIWEISVLKFLFYFWENSCKSSSKKDFFLSNLFASMVKIWQFLIGGWMDKTLTWPSGSLQFKQQGQFLFSTQFLLSCSFFPSHKGTLYYNNASFFLLCWKRVRKELLQCLFSCLQFTEPIIIYFLIVCKCKMLFFVIVLALFPRHF